MRQAVIVAMARTAVGKAVRGNSKNARSDDMAAAVIADLLETTAGALDPQTIDDVIMGCAMPEGAQGMNFARVIALRAGLPVDTPGQTVNRFCSSGLQAIALAANSIIADQADIVIAGGAESMSAVPMTGHHLSPNLHLAENDPHVYMSMGLTAERVVSEFGISREDMDEFAYNSHRKAAEATDAGYFAEEIVPIEWEETIVGGDGMPAVISKDTRPG